MFLRDIQTKSGMVGNYAVVVLQVCTVGSAWLASGGVAGRELCE